MDRPSLDRGPVRVLLLGSKKDPHIDRVRRALDRRAVDSAVLDYHDCVYAFRMDRAGAFSLAVDGRDVSATAAVFDRVLLRKETEFYPEGESGEPDFIADEYRALYGLVAELFGDQVVNSAVARRCLVKPHQQRHAAAVGFLVPTSLISNAKGTILGFLEYDRRAAVIKALSYPTYHGKGGDDPSRLVMTNDLAASDVRERHEEDLRICPSFIQERIEKDHELRVAWVDGEAFAFRIDSQTVASARTDWRRGARRLEYRPVELPQAALDRIAALMERLGFRAGHLDLVADETGELWFLECNNQGAWGWLDDIVDGRIADAMADLLVRVADRAEAEDLGEPPIDLPVSQAFEEPTLANGWRRLLEEGQLAVPSSGEAVVVIGLDGCGPCEHVRTQALAFASHRRDVSVDLYKTRREDWDGAVRAFGSPIRFFPTVIGFRDGRELFRVEGAPLRLRSDDTTVLERKFARS